MPALSTLSFLMKLRTRFDVLHSLQSNAEMLMSYHDLDPDSAMAEDVTLINQDY